MRQLLACIPLLLLSGCSILDTPAQQSVTMDHAWSTNADSSAFTTANVRVILKRTQPVLGTPVVCVEPSPDVAVALASAAGLTAKGGTTAVNGTLQLTGGSSEAVSELAGRSTALLALRDGLFQACEAYANGAIGQDDYALITSVYSPLMTTLFLAQDVTSASTAQARAMATAPAVPQPGSPGSDNGGGGSKTTAGPAPSGASFESAPSGLPAVTLSADDIGLPIQAVSAAAPARDAAAPTPAQTPSDGTSTADKQVTAGVGGNASAAMPLALVRMNEDSMHRGLLGVLLVACVNEFDPSRAFATSGGKPLANLWLQTLCGHLDDPAALAAIEVYTAVDPATAAIAAPSGGTRTATTPKKTTTVANKPTSPSIIYVHLPPVAPARHTPCEDCVSPPLKTLLRDPATRPLPAASSI
jgi:hypothetical protein